MRYGATAFAFASFRLAQPKLEERRLVGGDGFEPPTLSV